MRACQSCPTRNLVVLAAGSSPYTPDACHAVRHGVANYLVHLVFDCRTSSFFCPTPVGHDFRRAAEAIGAAFRRRCRRRCRIASRLLLWPIVGQRLRVGVSVRALLLEELEHFVRGVHDETVGVAGGLVGGE